MGMGQNRALTSPSWVHISGNILYAAVKGLDTKTHVCTQLLSITRV